MSRNILHKSPDNAAVARSATKPRSIPSRHIQCLRQRIGVLTERNQKILSQNFARMDWPHAVLNHAASFISAVIVSHATLIR